ncbi:SPOR domain-containing protein [Maritimibacter sp. 55A14]|uniref:SPOR domain-containing protein n=1 Tax=Maritimibacter sp. 55A14 TaxID=2174844 RepID=UPI000D60F189|nr:SPOR domain-containing protein [Maritimibacter sp. 55A14]PWE33976.1 SPOR domain-containing protein [Maritimibacter sp. 55A14]
MADIEYDLYEEDPASGVPDDPGVAGAVINWAGALVSVGLVVGLAVWGYQLGMRDVGQIPVVRALEGPMREAPEEPGGLDAAHQGLAVNSVQAEGGVDGPADKVILAPPPVELAEEDKPRAALRPPMREEALEEGVAIPAALRLEPAPEHEAPVPLALSPEDEVVRAAVAEAASEAVAVAAEAGESDAVEALPEDVAGPDLSPRPKPRPDVEVAALRNVTDAAAVSAAQSPELDPTEIAPGTRLVQLGAFDDASTARAEWDRLTAAHDDLLEGKSRVIQEAESSGRRFFRLRVAGFKGLDDSRRFCSAMLARDAACIPVTAR